MNTDYSPDPLEQLRAWLETEVVALATATRDGVPSVRMVLLKGADERGLVFFTGYESRKGRELAANPRAALLFYWDPLGRQVRVEGRLERTTPAETEAYFHTRPRGAQIAALASRQSEVLPNRAELERRVAELEAEHDDREVPVPPAWGGFRLMPDAYEFWQHRENRLHDRFRYRPEGDGWAIERLSP
jgi:pyridoxamine 5'-phosphate oxidase